MLLLSMCFVANQGMTTEKQVASQPLTVAVASNFYAPLKSLLAKASVSETFETKLVVGSSGALFAQAIHGAPFDIFLGADKARPSRLAETLATHHRPFTYAYGHLVIYPADDDIQPSVLNQARRVAIANPKLAPYGQAALHFIEAQKINMPIRVFGNNVSQVFQFADTGNVDFAITAESLLIQAYNLSQDNKYKRYFRLPDNAYPVIEQQGLILVSIEDKEKLREAERLVQFLLSDKAQMFFSTQGYRRVENSHE
ncbi:molybdate ABC transporter substrate-binding protein [Agaribacter flavus]|uniref:Molybdate ABC transporter substrate-binding protein n=1 Tax=Agaribacter flavus TaxID=1902781 RepID=A0ABV7FUP1_9ALTE